MNLHFDLTNVVNHKHCFSPDEDIKLEYFESRPLADYKIYTFKINIYTKAFHQISREQPIFYNHWLLIIFWETHKFVSE